MSLISAFIPSRSRTNGTSPDQDDSNFTSTVKPIHEIKETPEAWGVTVYLPGVSKENLELTAEERQLRVTGRRNWKQPDGWTTLYRETADAPFELVLTHDNAINLETIAAELRDGVLRVSLPKHEALKPRKIAVT